MKILIGCERSGSLQKAFLDAGFDAIGCDIQDPTHNLPFIKGDLIHQLSAGWDALFCFPPCTYLTKAQIHLVQVSPARYAKSLEAVEFCRQIMESPVPRIMMENPTGLLNTMYRQPNQIVRPCYFGDPYGKEIGLWLKDLPPLISTVFNPVRKSIDNHTHGRMTQPQRANARSSWERYRGLCAAIVSQMTVDLR